MSYSERMRYIQEEANIYVARNKVRDSSELTLMKQARATSTTAPQTVRVTTNLHTSQLMPPYQYLNDISSNTVYTGVGTSNDYSAILQGKQKCAICSDDDPVLNQYIIKATPCFKRYEFPFIQTMSSVEVYCKDPGFNVFFPAKTICAASTNIYYTPSA